MTSSVFYICEPTNTLYANKLFSHFINTPTSSSKWIIIGNTKFAVTAMNAHSHPQFITFDKRKDFFIRYCVDITNNRKLFP